MTRREQRIEAFKLIYQSLFTSEEFLYEEDSQLEFFSKELIQSYNSNKQELLNFISEKTIQDKRIYHIDLAIILLALSEIKLGVNPKEIIVNEAVEIAKLYSTEQSPSFINAFLKANI